MLPPKKRARFSNRNSDYSDFSTTAAENSDFFDRLPEDLVLLILSKLSSSVSRPSDFINVQLTCKRLRDLALHPPVLAKAGEKLFAVRAEKWSESSHRFLKNCVDAGNVYAWYTLGMIRFYCLQNRGSGLSLMAKAAMKSHAPALYSLAVIQFNGSGGSKNDKDLKAGVALCARAAGLGHIDALRELGHCLQDGYGVRQNIVQGRRLILQANAREFFSACGKLEIPPCELPESPLKSDFGCNVPAAEMHPVNLFLKEWFELRDGEGEVKAAGMRLCSHGGCGRSETRAHEFRQCSVCGIVNYCSRGCQALDWRLRHKEECVPMERWRDLEDGGDVEGGVAEVVEGAAVF